MKKDFSATSKSFTVKQVVNTSVFMGLLTGIGILFLADTISLTKDMLTQTLDATASQKANLLSKGVLTVGFLGIAGFGFRRVYEIANNMDQTIAGFKKIEEIGENSDASLQP